MTKTLSLLKFCFLKTKQPVRAFFENCATIFPRRARERDGQAREFLPHLFEPEGLSEPERPPSVAPDLSAEVSTQAERSAGAPHQSKLGAG
ncbi:MAG: hypothetical protein UX53_C0033G0004 [Candidatus Azambacteria bacterium GW2011_GWB2_46_37]|uniref:Uncharacterized protein n=1 Tax=Candidatus Azambacteria bacterium GW2011_GWB2_46_37 TaxID=1618618 RepID=A0A0G1PZH0_9BACT|nr:MAG: hypothetical protein UX53_C0033G0004 [Candidatus Azambacteria bacterium GW2011_GWB2_46_37]HCB36335.1 hypothetical protein [Candidatus Azambacteria bacterium]